MIEILDSNLKKIALLKKYTFSQYTEKFRGIGTFKVNIRLVDENLYLLDDTKTYFILFDGIVFGKIENIKKQSDSEYERIATISGRLANFILTKRIVNGTINYKGNTAGLVKELIESEITKNKNSNRYINIKISYEDANMIDYVTSNIEKQITGGYLWDIIEEVLEQDKLGMFFTPIVEPTKVVDGVETNISEWNLVITTGNYRTRSNNPYGLPIVVFSQNLSNIARTDYTLDNKEYCNVAYVAGEGMGDERYWYETYQDDGNVQKGWNRSELWIDARDIQSESSSGTTLTDEEYEELIKQRAKEKFAEANKTKSYTATLTEANKQYVYGKDYYLGDFVTVEDKELDISLDAQITEVTTSEEGNRKIVDIEFTYGTIQKDVTEQIKQNEVELYRNTNNIKYIDLVSEKNVNKIEQLQNDIAQLKDKISVYISQEGEVQYQEGKYHWKYRMYNNGDFEVWRIYGKNDTFVTSHGSSNGWFYSDESTWYPNGLPFKVTKIEQILATGNRNGAPGLTYINIVKNKVLNGVPYVTFIIVSNKNGAYDVSCDFYIRGTYEM